jgi:hypothetical protein
MYTLYVLLRFGLRKSESPGSGLLHRTDMKQMPV